MTSRSRYVRRLLAALLITAFPPSPDLSTRRHGIRRGLSSSTSMEAVSSRLGTLSSSTCF